MGKGEEGKSARLGSASDTAPRCSVVVTLSGVGQFSSVPRLTANSHLDSPGEALANRAEQTWPCARSCSLGIDVRNDRPIGTSCQGPGRATHLFALQ